MKRTTLVFLLAAISLGVFSSAHGTVRTLDAFTRVTSNSYGKYNEYVSLGSIRVGQIIKVAVELKESFDMVAFLAGTSSSGDFSSWANIYNSRGDRIIRMAYESSWLTFTDPHLSMSTITDTPRIEPSLGFNINTGRGYFSLPNIRNGKGELRGTIIYVEGEINARIPEVPDSGSTLLLLVASLTCLIPLRKKLSAARN